jgi:hypothetical protein
MAAPKKTPARAGKPAARTKPARVCCAEFGCNHAAPRSYAPLIIRWGGNTPSNVLRQRARCMRCGHLGATLRHPSWSGDIA